MKKLIFLLSALAIISISHSCSKESGGTSETTYSDMQITEFAYAEISAAGGTVAPSLAYKYKVTSASGKVEERTSGAKIEYSCISNQIKINTETGIITASANQTVEPISFIIEVSVTIGDATDRREISAVQAGAANDVISSEQYLAPLELLPHTAVFKSCNFIENHRYTFDWDKEFEYQSYSKNGIRDKSFLEYLNESHKGVIDINFSEEYSWIENYGTDIEYISVKGENIDFVGGGLFRIDTYRSGEKDTVLIAAPSYSSETIQNKGSWSDWEYWLKGEERYYIGTIKDPNINPASVVGNTWQIFSEGATRAWCTHTLTSNADGHIQSITVKQNDNIIVGIDSGYVRFTGNYSLTNVRDSWPEIEDYPAGSTPKWPKNEDGDYWPTIDTKSLHPDSDRYVHIIFDVEAEQYCDAPILMSREIAEHQLSSKYWSKYNLRGGIIITAEAEIPIEGGNTRYEKHVSKWEEPKPGTWNSSVRESHFAIELPTPVDAIGDFEWKLSFAFHNEDGSYNHWGLPSTYPLSRTNVNEVEWNFPVLKVSEKRSSIEEWKKTKWTSGIVIFGTSLCTDNRQLGDFIDGVPNPKEY